MRGIIVNAQRVVALPSVKAAGRVAAIGLALVVGRGGWAVAQEAEGGLVKQVQNPVSSLISLPFQNNTNFGIGSNDRTQNVVNVQPVIPVSVSRDWNIINRIIAPVVYQPDVGQPDGGTFGLGDINYTAFLAPGQPGKIIWGVGPQLVFPTATDDALGTDKWAIGPSVVLLTTPSPWVIGVLVSNIWSFAGDSDRADVNQMLIQYFINYNLPNGWYISSAPIITANWEAPSGEEWLVPFGGGVGKIFAIGRQPLNGSVAAFWNAIHPDTLLYPDWTLRLALQFLFPK